MQCPSSPSLVLEAASLAQLTRCCYLRDLSTFCHSHFLPSLKLASNLPWQGLTRNASMALRFGNHRLPLLGGKFQNSPQALRLIQSGPPNIHQWAGIINQLRASNCGIQRRFRSRRGLRLPSCVFVASKDHHSAIFHPHKYISLLRITLSLSYFTSKSGKSFSGENNRAGFVG